MKKYFIALFVLSVIIFSFQNCAKPLGLDTTSQYSLSEPNDYFDQIYHDSEIFNEGRTIYWAKVGGNAKSTHIVKFIKPSSIQVFTRIDNPNTTPVRGELTKHYNLDQDFESGCHDNLIKEGTVSGALFKTYLKVCLN